MNKLEKVWFHSTFLVKFCRHSLRNFKSLRLFLDQFRMAASKFLESMNSSTKSWYSKISLFWLSYIYIYQSTSWVWDQRTDSLFTFGAPNCCCKVSEICNFKNSLKIIRNNCPEVFCRNGVLGSFVKFTWKHLCQSLFFNKTEGLRYRWGSGTSAFLRILQNFKEHFFIHNSSGGCFWIICLDTMFCNILLDGCDVISFYGHGVFIFNEMQNTAYIYIPASTEIYCSLYWISALTCLFDGSNNMVKCGPTWLVTLSSTWILSIWNRIFITSSNIVLRRY